MWRRIFYPMLSFFTGCIYTHYKASKKKITSLYNTSKQSSAVISKSWDKNHKNYLNYLQIYLIQNFTTQTNIISFLKTGNWIKTITVQYCKDITIYFHVITLFTAFVVVKFQSYCASTWKVFYISLTIHLWVGFVLNVVSVKERQVCCQWYHKSACWCDGQSSVKHSIKSLQTIFRNSGYSI